MKSLKEKILEDMTSDYSNALDRNFDTAKQLIKLTKEGLIEVLNKDKLGLEEQISLYFIGKLYSQEVGFSQTDRVSNEELQTELGLSEGSVRPTLMKLRNSKKIKQDKIGKISTHYFSVNLIEPTLNKIFSKINGEIKNG